MIIVEMSLIEEEWIESQFCDHKSVFFINLVKWLMIDYFHRNQTKQSIFYIAKQQTSFNHHYSSLAHLSALHANWSVDSLIFASSSADLFQEEYS